MKQNFSIILFLILALSISGCKAENKAPNEPADTERTEQYEHVCVDVSGEGGYYALTAKTRLEYYENELVSIFVNDPTLLAFKIPDQYTNGVGVIDGNDVKAIVDNINTHLTTTEVDEKTEKLLSYIADKMNNIAIVTSAST